MNHLLSLVLLVGGESFTLDYNLSMEDCLTTLYRHERAMPASAFECQWQVPALVLQSGSPTYRLREQRMLEDYAAFRAIANGEVQ